MKGLFFITLPDKERGYSGANIGNRVILEKIKKRDAVEVVDYSMKMSHPGETASKLSLLIYYISVISCFCNSYFNLSRVCRKGKFDYFYFLPSASVPGMVRDLCVVILVRLLSRNTVNIIAHVRNGNYTTNPTKSKYREALKKLSLRQVDKFIVLSNMLVSDQFRAMADSCSCQIFVVPNTIDSEMLPTKDEIEKVKKSDDAVFRVTYLSNFIESKGYLKLLQAALEVLDKQCSSNSSSKYKFYFCGRWSSEKDKRKFIDMIPHEYKADIVLMEPLTSRDECRKLLVSTDIFVLPTSYKVEAQPRSILEAMANGCAIFASKHASIPDMLKEDINGHFVDNIKDIVDALEKSSHNSLNKYKENSRNIFSREFSEMVVDNKIYEAIS